jgi:hypothetical protein
MRAIILTALVAMLFSLFSCSAEWHLRKAYSKDIRLARLDTTTTSTKVTTPAVSGVVHVVQVQQKPVTMYFPREYSIPGETIRDTVRLTLTALDSARIQADVDCPPVEIREKIIRIPEIVEVEKKNRLDWLTRLLGIAAAVIIVILLISRR